MHYPPFRQKTFGGVISQTALKGELHRLGSDFGANMQGTRQGNPPTLVKVLNGSVKIRRHSNHGGRFTSAKRSD
jgi:hypothetical protein